MATALISAHCGKCTRELHHEEHGRIICTRCRNRTDADLAAIPGLYRQLSDNMAPRTGASEEPRVSTSRVHAPLPIKIGALSLVATGGVVTVLHTWLEDIHRLRGWTPPQRRPCPDMVKALRVNLDWMAEEHPAFTEFAREIADLVFDCRRQMDGAEKHRKKFGVRCSTDGCGNVLRTDLDTDGTRCSCGTRYDRDALLSLDLVGR